ncbi:WXG100 family type VII secretion target [Streptomyces sp. NPDC051639]|uniref:WXG100 family type VII secretion target n=1 Tax=Streptomyces sp. NPDC051639 TaxID=3155671 RepID=UPI003433992A
MPDDVRTIDGHPVPGRSGPDGAFVSRDGTIYVSPDGEVVHGLTAPDGHFLPNGESRVVDGRTVWGSVGDDGSFLSEDGTTYVTSDGKVEHGKLSPDGHFLVPKVVGGQTLWGSETKDGGFLSEDGKTYVDPSGTVEHGVTTPDGQFIRGGTARTMPDGSISYGSKAGDDFVTSDGRTIILNNGTELHGHLDTTTGLFTTGKGDTYFVGDKGVTHGHFRPADGAFVLDGDNGVVMTPHAWKVDLQKMRDVIAVIDGKRWSIRDSHDVVSSNYSLVANAWTSPAGDTFSDVRDQTQAAMSDLEDLIGNLVDRLGATYDTYVKTERANTENVSQK